MKLKKLFLFLLTGIILMNFVSSLGITPGRTTLNFEPNLQKEVSFSILNSENKDMSVVFMIRGELNETVTLNQAYAEFSSTEASKSFTYIVNLPSKIETPGKYEIEIVALELPKDLEKAGATVGATVAVITQLYIQVPYPNKYLDGEVNVLESDSETIFSILVTNRGKLDIVNARATIDIYTALNEKVATIETNEQSLLSLERKELIARLDHVEINSGKYFAKVNVFYDNEVFEIEKEFLIGEMSLQILEVLVKDFQLGEIAKFNALVENKWSDKISDSYLNIVVYNKEGEIMADFKSPNYDLSGLSKSELVAYWDTGGVSSGTYDGKLILRYGDKEIEKNIQLKISDDELEVLGITGQVIVRGGDSNINWNTILIIVIIVLLVLNIVWFVIIRKFMKRRK